ncbi:PHD finger protein 21A [Nymphon striatum]|nr:PHD finger protein 21A [Nymphon striatum]
MSVSHKAQLAALQKEIKNLSDQQTPLFEQLRSMKKEIEIEKIPKFSPFCQEIIKQTNAVFNGNNNYSSGQVIIEFSTQNNNCTVLPSVSPIRVPHYQPVCPSPNQKPKIAVTTNDSTVPLQTQTKLSPSKLEKNDFMLSLGLITQSRSEQLKKKRLERKRRTTANPQFSSSALEEKRKLNSILASNVSPNFKRPRGRPRLVANTAVPTPPSNSPVVNGHVLNGIKKGVNAINGETKNHNKCASCGGSGELVMCESCKSVYHPSCVDLQNVPSSQWSCPQCANGMNWSNTTISKKVSKQWTDSYAAVNNRISLLSEKVQEKCKLEKRELELKTESTQLSNQLNHLHKVLDRRTKANLKLKTDNLIIEANIKHFEEFITAIKKS